MSAKPQIGPPRFCTRCRLSVRSEEQDPSHLCWQCGDPWQAQGYCPVCERYWKEPVGSECRKHEGIRLETGPREASFQIEPGSVKVWKIIRAYADPILAQTHRLRLEAEGIPALLENEHMGLHYPVATGGIKLKVPESLFAEARVLLSQSWTLPEDDAIAGAVWDEDDTPNPPAASSPFPPALVDDAKFLPRDWFVPVFIIVLLAAAALLVLSSLRPGI